MTNYYGRANWIGITKSEAQKIHKRMKKCIPLSKFLREFNVKHIRNGRGDYGQSDLYFYDGLLYLICDVDGGLSEVRYYKTDKTEEVLKSMENAKS